MDNLISFLISVLLSGGPHAISAILLLVIVLLLLDRKRLLADLTKKEERLDQTIENYYKGNITLAEALNSLKSVLFEIKSKI